MNHVSRLEIARARGNRASRETATDLSTLLHDCWPASAVNCPVDPSTTSQPLIRRVPEGIGSKNGDVPSPKAQDRVTDMPFDSQLALNGHHHDGVEHEVATTRLRCNAGNGNEFAASQAVGTFTEPADGFRNDNVVVDRNLDFLVMLAVKGGVNPGFHAFTPCL